MSPTDPQMLALRLGRRQRRVRRMQSAVALAAGAGGLALLAAGAQRLWWPGLPLAPVLLGLALAALAALAWQWWRAPRESLRLVRRADRQAGGEEQLSTAYELQTAQPDHRFLPLLLARCQALLERVDVAAVVPVSLGRAATGALAFAALAGLLYLVPASWMRATIAPAPHIAPLVAAEAAALEELAGELAQLAEENAFRFVEQLADAMESTAEQLLTEELSAVEAAEQIEALSQLADEFADARRGEKPPEFDGEGYEETEPRATPAEEPSDEAESLADLDASGAREPNRTDEGGESQQVTAAEEQQREVPQPEEDMAPTDVPESPYARAIRDPNSEMEMEILENNQVRLQQTARNMLEQYMSEDTDVSDLTSDPMDSTGDPAGDELDTGETETATPEETEMQASGQEGEMANESSEAPSQAKEDDRKEADPVGQAAFEDTRIAGQEADPGVEDARWVRQLPVLNAREIRADGTVPQFARTTVTARSGRALPRAYRSVVKAYYLELERLTTGAE